jgi:hypothetical protein
VHVRAVVAMASLAPRSVREMKKRGCFEVMVAEMQKNRSPRDGYCEACTNSLLESPRTRPDVNMINGPRFLILR